MGSAEKVCTIHTYKLFVVAQIVFFGNDSEKLSGRLRGLSHWKYLMVLTMDWGYYGYVVLFVIKSTNM